MPNFIYLEVYIVEIKAAQKKTKDDVAQLAEIKSKTEEWLKIQGERQQIELCKKAVKHQGAQTEAAETEALQNTTQ